MLNPLLCFIAKGFQRKSKTNKNNLIRTHAERINTGKVNYDKKHSKSRC